MTDDTTARPARLRILADDLTGALDAAAELVGAFGPIETRWRTGQGLPRAGSAALDTATRELAAGDAVVRLAPLAPWLAGGDIAFKKIDSLLRGPWAAELAALLAAGPWRRCLLAPAFPAQGRSTLRGVQLRRVADGSFAPVGPAIEEALAACGIVACTAGPDGDWPEDGVVVLDAATEADLERIAQWGLGLGDGTLWCGTGGLARALGGRGIAADVSLVTPALGLVGSDQAVSRAQLAAVPSAWLQLGAGDGPAPVAARLAAGGVALVSAAMPEGAERHAARRHIAERFERLVGGLGRPGTLIVVGGETLRGVCEALGAEALRVTGQVAPGVPRSTLVGGRWPGLPVISKSGAFGESGFFHHLLAANALLP